MPNIGYNYGESRASAASSAAPYATSFPIRSSNFASPAPGAQSFEDMQKWGERMQEDFWNRVNSDEGRFSSFPMANASASVGSYPSANVTFNQHESRQHQPTLSNIRIHSANSNTPNNQCAAIITQDPSNPSRDIIKWCIDVEDFRPENISVKTYDDASSLEVSAKQTNVCNGVQQSREFSKSISIPSGTAIHQMKSTYSLASKQLTIQAPFTQPRQNLRAVPQPYSREYTIPVHHTAPGGHSNKIASETIHVNGKAQAQQPTFIAPPRAQSPPRMRKIEDIQSAPPAVPEKLRQSPIPPVVPPKPALSATVETVEDDEED